MPRRPVHDGLFNDDHLIGGRCAACGRHHFPAADVCPYCGAADVARVELSDSGTLWGWTAVTAAPPASPARSRSDSVSWSCPKGCV